MSSSLNVNLDVKICGITNADQAQAISALGFKTLGFICVQKSPRYITPSQIGQIVQQLQQTQPHWQTHGQAIGVFADATLANIEQTVNMGRLTGIQLHGQEDPDFCQQIKDHFPDKLIIKALRVKSAAVLAQAKGYTKTVDVLLLDAYHPQQLGGTGHTLPWEELQHFAPSILWWLAGGLTPDNVQQALMTLSPQGIDLSGGVERAPGDKDLILVKRLKQALSRWVE